MKIPYGIANFKKLRIGNFLYIDKTKFIETLENLSTEYIFFIRPRRFGKSLFLSVLDHYYDINAASEFNNLFGDLYIGQNPTPLKNSYLILKLNFSGLNTANKEKLENSFRLSIISDITMFLSKYKNIFDNADELEKEIKQIKDIKEIISFIFKQVQNKGEKIYLIIDEYDHFANDIIVMGDGDFYKGTIRATGFVRDFYEALKIGTESSIDRIFITGISPVMLDDLTSGFNIASNLTMRPELNEMLGFTEAEVLGIIDRLNIKVTMPNSGQPLTQKQLMVALKKNYNGYLFNEEAQQRVYNPSMTLYFFNQCKSGSQYPKNIIDDNIKTDYGRLNRLAANEANKKTLDKIIKNEGITATIATRFSFDNMNDREYFVSLLFYMGLLTIGGMQYGKTRLVMPNYITKEMFWEYFEKRLRIDFGIEPQMEELAKVIWDIATYGEIKPFLDYISEHVLQELSNRDLIQFDEKHFKVIIFAYLTTSRFYHIISEREVSSGYIDIYLEKDLRVPDIKYEWVIELKYLKESERDQLEQVKQKGLEQLHKYMASKSLTAKKDLKKALVIFIGKKDYVLVEEK
ncbi:MAG: ATP-binding protein [Desulfotomaculum sp.]|nr:ATP-binding protein [Desulfotomaculum sp.]